MVVTIQGYSSVERVGEGGFGTLYRAVRDATGEVVAIKELWNVPDGSPIALRLRHELDALEPLKGNPDIVHVQEIVEGPQGMCLVTEFAPGGSLMDRVSRSALSEPELVLAGLHAARALAAAHSLGIVHGDVKPQNMLIDLFGQVKVSDFGMAALFRVTDDVGPAADIASFGITFIHLATGKRPSAGERFVTETTDPHMEAVFEAIRRCISPQPEERPTMAELVALFEIASDGIIDATPVALDRIGVLATTRPRVATPRPKSPARLEFERATMEAELARRAAIEDELEVSRRKSRNIRRAVTAAAAVVGLVIACLVVIAFARSREHAKEAADIGDRVAANPGLSTGVAYFQAISKPSEEVFAAAQALVAPGSPAAEFLYHEQRLFEARTLDDSDSSELTSFIEGESIALCSKDGCNNKIVASKFRIVGGNRLESFDLDGQPLDEVIDIWSGANAPCGASYIEALGGSASDGCDSDNLILVVRSVLRQPSGRWTLTYDLKHGSNWAQTLAYAETDASGAAQSPVKLELGATVLQATSWSTTVPASGTTAVGYATFDVPDEATVDSAELTIATISSDANGAWGCDDTPVCPLAVAFTATPGG